MHAARRSAVWAVSVLLGLGSVQFAAAQTPGIQWQRDVQAAVAQAQKAKRPLMFYVIGSSEGRDDFEGDHRRAFQDPLVVRLASRYVAVQLQKSQHQQLVAGWSVGRSANGDLVFTKPDGKEIDSLGASGVAKVDSLRQKLHECFRAFRDDLFQTELQPIFAKEDAAAKDLKAALAVIDDYHISSAESAVVGLLDRTGLDKTVRASACEVLARLSGPAGARKLLELAEKDKAASDALKKAEPPAAEELLTLLTPELLSTDPSKFAFIYDVVTKICKIKNVKPAKFWEGKNEKIKSDEIDRVRDLVRKSAKQWSEQNEYR